MITSLQNPRLKLVRALMGRAKERREAGAFVAEGVRLVEEAAKANWPVQFVLYDETLNERGMSNIRLLTSIGVEVEQVASHVMRSLSETESPQGILAVINLYQLPWSPASTFILIPDQVRDPGNLGTLIRSADAAGVDLVLIPPETTDPFAPKVVRAGMGTHFHLPIRSMNWEEIRTSGVPASQRVLLADMQGDSCWEADLRQPLTLIVGGEAKGASAQARELAGQHIRIPMTGRTESLNAAVAGSVLMFEVMRQRKEK
jgi:RNA methyltransferase, TrmH family